MNNMFNIKNLASVVGWTKLTAKQANFRVRLSGSEHLSIRIPTI